MHSDVEHWLTCWLKGMAIGHRRQVASYYRQTGVSVLTAWVAMGWRADTLHKFLYPLQFEGGVSVLKSTTTFRRDPVRLRKWANGSTLKSNLGKWQALP